MSDLYSVIPSLTPSSDEIVEAELLAKQILEAEFPDIDLREGTGLRDLVLRPTSFAMALLKKATDYYFSSNVISGVNDTTDTEIVDDILSNWFITRNTGEVAVISARLYFAVQKNITLPGSTYFSTDNSIRFFPNTTLTFSANSLSFDLYQNEWYIDINLVGEQAGTAYNIGEGSLLYFTNFDPYFLHAEINYLESEASDSETNTQFINRSKSAISTRNLINDPSVTSNLQSAFNTLSRITTVGMGDEDMIRDQVKVIFDPETPRSLTGLSCVANTATAILVEHGFEVGQDIVISGSSPVEYNGNFTITWVDLNTFKFEMTSTPNAVTTMPEVQSVTSPCLVHIGGKVDVYCGDTVGSGLVQLTTDADGVTELEGPIYSFFRSNTTGGADLDTIPVTSLINTTSVSLDVPNKILHVTSVAPHNLLNGYVVEIQSLTQTKPINSISCTNLVVTVVSTNHGLTTGNKVEIQGVTPSYYNGTHTITVIGTDTFTYPVDTNILIPGTGSSMIISNTYLEGLFPIVYTGTSTFDVSLPGTWAIATTNNSQTSIQYSVPYSVSNPYLQTKELISMNGVGTTVTATLTNHGYAANRFVSISGATPSYYNGTWKISSILSSNQFTFNIDSTILAPASGTLHSTYTIPWQDLGFSDSQKLKISFGAGYANSTASFEIQYFDKVSPVQQYLTNSENHVLCGGYIARGFNMYVLDIDVVVYNSVTPSTSAVQAAAKSYLDSLAPGATFVMGDLGSSLSSAGITNVQTPIGVSYTYYHRDLITPTTGTIVDYLDPLDKTNIFIIGKITTSSVSV